MTHSANDIDTLLAEGSVPLYNIKSTTENELKLVTTNGSPKPFKRMIKDLHSDKVPGIELVHHSAPQTVVARQIDTEDMALRERGITLRIRGTYHADGRWTDTDINIKTKRSSGVAMKRGEFETRIPDPTVIDLPALREKYREQLEKGELPDLEEALEIIHPLSIRGALKEHFLVAARRQRNVIALDSEVLGYGDNQQFFGEMPYDTVKYVVRSAALQESRLMHVPKGYRELEMEPLHVPCTYNPYSGSEHHVCRNVNEAEEDMAIVFVTDTVMRYADLTGVAVEAAGQSKAGRGFSALQQQKEFIRSISGEVPDLKAMFNTAAPSRLLQVNAPPLLLPTADFSSIPYELKAA